MSNITKSILPSIVSALVFSLALPSTAEAVPAKRDKAHSKVSFMSYTTIFDAEGVFKKWDVSGDVDSADFTKSNITVTVDPSSVDTDNGKRDAHLKEKDFFWVKKYPDATFKTSKITHKGGDKYNLKGVLTVRGVSKTISMPITAKVVSTKDGKKALRVRGKKKLKRQDFGITYKAGFLLPTIRDDVDLRIDINFSL